MLKAFTGHSLPFPFDSFTCKFAISIMPAMQNRQLLTFDAELIDGAPLVVLSNSSPVTLIHKEPAGRSFHEAALRRLGYSSKIEVDDVSTAEKKEKIESASVRSYHFKGKKKNSADGDQQDHYALLGLSHLRFLATEEQIRKSYRDVALKHHPDKQAILLLQEETEESREAKKEEIDRYFKSIQEAYEVLIDPSKRRLYDSVDEFDDEVPSECSPGDFFEVFGPVFVRNGRWSIAQPVPALGDDCTSIADVDSFYDFWWSFKSWREFPHADEFDLEQAESREHKRWMERQNGKLREKAKREENGRIRTLVENAYKRDPRILRRRDEEKADKLRKKQAKVLAKREKELEAARLVEEERLRKVEENRKVALEVAAQKKVREKEKKLLRKERQRLRAAAAPVIERKDFRISEEALESLCTSLEMAEMTRLCEDLEGSNGVEKIAEILRTSICCNQSVNLVSELPNLPNLERCGRLELMLEDPQISLLEDHTEVSLQQPDTTLVTGSKIYVECSEQWTKSCGVLNGVKKEKPWTQEELGMLRKAITKFPKGTSQRWEVVANYIGTGRTVDEILKAIRTVILQKPDSAKAFDSFLSKRKPAKVLPSPLSTGDDLLTAGSSFTYLVPPANSCGSVGDPGLDRCEGFANGVTFTGDGSIFEEGFCQSKGSVSADVNGNSCALGEQLWSELQEFSLVKALKTFPKDTAQRWDRIAAAVPGKTKAQCFKKFSELRENFRSKKGHFDITRQ